MNVTFLIGNGFDINIGLKTSYPDFYNYYIEIYNDNPIIKDFKTYLSQEENRQKENWSDLESLLGEYTINVSTKEDLKTLYYDIYEQLQNYIEDQDHSTSILYNLDRNKFIDDLVIFEKYTYRYEDEQKITSIKNSSSNMKYNLITFNYTKTLEYLIKNAQNLSNKDNKKISISDVIHVHGLYDKENMILGVNDISQINNKEFKNDQDVTDFLIKTESNKVINNIGIYKKFQEIVNTTNVFCVFGLSMGKTDAIWWDKIMQYYIVQDCIIVYFVYEKNSRIKHQFDFGSIEREYQKNIFKNTTIKIDYPTDRIFVEYNRGIFKDIASKKE